MIRTNACVQTLELDPVSADDAIEQMENVGHDFFVYRDLESDQIQVSTIFRSLDLPSLHTLVHA